MASEYTPSRIGQVNQANAVDAIFNKVFSGEVLTQFDQKTVMQDKQLLRQITSGKSAQFPVIGSTAAVRHSPGNEITGTAISHNEKTILIDDLLIAHTVLYNLDEAKNHYDVRSEYSKQLGAALAKVYDVSLLATALGTARAAAANITSPSSGVQSEVVESAAKTDGEALANAIITAATQMDELDVPEEDRYCFVKPAQYRLLTKTTKVLNVDWNGSGSYSEGKVFKIGGVQLVKTNNLPVTNTAGNTTDVYDAGVLNTTASGGTTGYNGDFSTVAALVMHRSAVGTVQLLDLSMESEYKVNWQGTLFVAKMAVGHGTLRPESAVQIVTTATA